MRYSPTTSLPVVFFETLQYSPTVVLVSSTSMAAASTPIDEVIACIRAGDTVDTGKNFIDAAQFITHSILPCPGGFHPFTPANFNARQ